MARYTWNPHSDTRTTEILLLTRLHIPVGKPNFNNAERRKELTNHEILHRSIKIER